MDNKEKWLWINGFEGLYKVSNLGNVYSFKSGKYLSNKRLTKDGYVHVALRRDGKAYEFRTHRLVATHFLENPFGKETINHIDGNKLNNSAVNLEWATRHENMQHAYDLGLKKRMRGCEHPSSKLSEKQIKEILQIYKRYKKGYGSVALAKKYGVESSTILRIVNGRRYV